MEYNGTGEWNRVDPHTERAKLAKKYESNPEDSAIWKINVLRKGVRVTSKPTLTRYFQLEPDIFAKLVKELGRVLWPYSGDEAEDEWIMPQDDERDKIYNVFVQKFDNAIEEIKKVPAEKKLPSPLVTPFAPVTPKKKDKGAVPPPVSGPATPPSLPSNPNEKTSQATRSRLSRSESEELLAPISEAEEDIEGAAGATVVEEPTAIEAGQGRVEDEITINDRVTTGSKRKQGDDEKEGEKKQTVVYKRTKATGEEE